LLGPDSEGTARNGSTQTDKAMKLTAKQIDRYRLDPAAFIEERLIDPITNRPFVLLPAERAFVKLAFEIDEEIGRLRYPEMVCSTGRKGGKTGFAAMIRAADQDRNDNPGLIGKAQAGMERLLSALR
jgi:hypothetical protein